MQIKKLLIAGALGLLLAGSSGLAANATISVDPSQSATSSANLAPIRSAAASTSNLAFTDDDDTVEFYPDTRTQVLYVLGQPTSPEILSWTDDVFCNVIKDEDHVIFNFDNVAHKGGITSSLIALKCGTNTTSGYFHIKAEHSAEWLALDKLQWNGNGNWDDVMAWATDVILQHPKTAVSAGSGKTCLAAPIHLKNIKTGEIVKTIHPTVIVSNTNNLIVTSYPTTTNAC